MEKEFLNHEQSLALKELGFNEPCLVWYGSKEYGLEIGIVRKDGLIKYVEDVCFAPTISQALRFFREKYNMLANVYSNGSGFLYEYSDTIGGTHRFDSGFDGPNESGCWNTYEAAEQACLDKLIELAKEN